MTKKSTDSRFNLKGRGVLKGLISESQSKKIGIDEEAAQWISTEKLQPNPHQPRQYFSQDSIDRLAQSFSEQGFKGAINVRTLGSDQYEIVAGERRWRAAKQAGLKSVRCIVDDYSNEQALEFALVENLQREDLSKLEETEGLLRLIEAKLNIPQEKAIQLVRTQGHSDNRARSDVAPREELEQIIKLLNTFGIELQTFRTKNLRTLALPDDLKQAHLKKGLSYSSALEINKIKNDDLRAKVLQVVLKKNLSFRQTKDLVAEELSKVKEGKERPAVQKKLIDRIERTLKTVKEADNILGKPKKRKELEVLLEQIEELLEEEWRS
jgi:ParB family chromosome partitioning protein